MNPVFRSLTRCNICLDAAIYDNFSRDESAAIFVQVCVMLGAMTLLGVQVFGWGLGDMQSWNWVLMAVSVLMIIACICGLYDRVTARDHFLKAQNNKRKAKVGSGELLMGVLFYSDHLVQFDMLAGKAERLDYEKITEIRSSEQYIFLLTEKEIGMISLEKAGIAGKTPSDAIQWLTVRSGCKRSK